MPTMIQLNRWIQPRKEDVEVSIAQPQRAIKMEVYICLPIWILVSRSGYNICLPIRRITNVELKFFQIETDPVVVKWEATM